LHIFGNPHTFPQKTEQQMLSNRQKVILGLLDERGTAQVAALATELGVSTESIRRDVRTLEGSGHLVRTHGAVGLAGQIGEAPFHRRMRENADAKRSIAKAVARTIRDGDSVMLDTGTTTSFLARELVRHRNLTIVTNSSDIARALATQNGNRVFMAGGELRPDSGAALGRSANDFVSQFAVNHAVISVGAIDANGLMDFDLAEAEFARVVLSCGERRIAAADHSKFDRRGLISVCRFDALTDFYTDAAPPQPIADALASAGVRPSTG
jgi:DeoR family glycerol-3-phosphate regulon repressor